MKSYSQAGQDLFAWEMLQHPASGFYLDIGCNHPVAINNTYAFEEMGWDGILVDILPGCEIRKGRFFKCDAANPSPELLAAYSQMPKIVDFLSLDVDEASMVALHTLPWNTHRIRVACIEHDAYAGKTYRSDIRNVMSSLGYTLVCADVGIRFPDPNGTPGPFEDWFCNPDLVSHELIERFRCSGKEWCEIVKGII